MTLPQLENYRLVGGTALALMHGHRKSIDIDLFGEDVLDWDVIEQDLRAYAVPQLVSKSRAILTFVLNGVKVDIVRYTYPWLAEVKVEENIRLAAIQDIAAMKLNAIVGRGVKKDFIDLDLLLNHFSLKEMITLYRAKYQQTSDFMLIKSLDYFADAEKNDDPEMLTPYHWETIKERIKTEVKKLALS
jgi:hypothetical protein